MLPVTSHRSCASKTVGIGLLCLLAVVDAVSTGRVIEMASCIAPVQETCRVPPKKFEAHGK